MIRCDPPKFEPKPFPVYGPKAFAAIGSLPDTLTDRSLCITMQRKTPSQTVERFLQSKARAEIGTLCESLPAWADANRQTVESAYRKMGDLTFLGDRDAEIWMPLFAVCAVDAQGNSDVDRPEVRGEFVYPCCWGIPDTVGLYAAKANTSRI